MFPEEMKTFIPGVSVLELPDTSMGPGSTVAEAIVDILVEVVG